jgi:oligopeptide/dipeptide ABC transporter ATP-binding protein
MSTKTLLEVTDLTTYFYTPAGVLKAVDGISYDVNESEIVAIVGESGCGKSVSALSILRLIPDPPGKIVKGEVIFEERDLLRLDEKEIRRVRGNRIGMVFQEPMQSLNPVLSIGRQVIETLELHLKMDRASAKKKAIELLRLVGIPDAPRRIDSYPHEFSGGMRQRVMIAMALSCNPKLLIADEPTTSVDVTIQAQLFKLMRDTTQQLGTALIVITHNLGVVARYAQRVNVMYAGRIIERGPAKDIYGDARHPYTKGLLAAVPRLDEPRRVTLVPIEGVPPDLFNLPGTCAFLPRCGYAIGKCQEELWPKLVTVAEGHEVACYVDIREKREL